MPFEYQFPDPSTADHDGLLAAGGDLSVESLVTAYSRGIFPWFDKHSPILWWSPDPRLVLFPGKFLLSASLKQRIHSGIYTVITDHDFEGVIRQCASAQRKEQDGTWITEDMINAYINLHHAGLAHSFETYYKGELVGGLYGVSLGKAFFGESMFFLMRDASKVALHSLVDWALRHEFLFIDAQQSTPHLKSLGAEEIDRRVFLKLLKESLAYETIRGKWEMQGRGTRDEGQACLPARQGTRKVKSENERGQGGCE
jgi:leucyl/phenylalanyl-tRNA--protein transferase